MASCVALAAPEARLRPGLPLSPPSSEKLTREEVNTNRRQPSVPPGDANEPVAFEGRQKEAVVQTGAGGGWAPEAAHDSQGGGKNMQENCGRGRDSGGGGGGGDGGGGNSACCEKVTATGRNLMRPFVINVDEEVSEVES